MLAIRTVKGEPSGLRVGGCDNSVERDGTMRTRLYVAALAALVATGASYLVYDWNKYQSDCAALDERIAELEAEIEIEEKPIFEEKLKVEEELATLEGREGDASQSRLAMLHLRLFILEFEPHELRTELLSLEIEKVRLWQDTACYATLEFMRGWISNADGYSRPDQSSLPF